MNNSLYIFTIFLINLITLFSPLPSFCQQDNIKDDNSPTMTLVECIAISLKNNFDLQSSFLDRIVQRFDLRLAKDQFNPRQFKLQLQMQRSSELTDHYDYGDYDEIPATGSLQTTVFSGVWKIPTGGVFSFNWQNQANQGDQIDSSNSGDYPYSGQWSITFTQPLLKGGGKTVATADLKKAYLTEEKNLINLKDLIMQTINTTITKYRQYLLGSRNLVIANNALDSARMHYKDTKSLIEAKKKPASDIIDDELNIAQQELFLETARDNLDNSRLDLLQFLNLPPDFSFTVVEEFVTEVTLPKLENALDIAIKNRSEYQSRLQDIESAKIDHTVASNSRLWDLSLSGSIGRSASSNRYRDVFGYIGNKGRNDWSSQLTLSIPFRDLDTERQYLNAKVSLEKTKVYLKKTEVDIYTDIRNKLRDVGTQYSQLRIAKKVRDVAEKSYKIEQNKYMSGKSNKYDLVQKQNDFLNAQYQELQYKIGCLNALTALDYALGTTLKTWGIDINLGSNSAK